MNHGRWLRTLWHLRQGFGVTSGQTHHRHLSCRERSYHLDVEQGWRLVVTMFCNLRKKWQEMIKRENAIRMWKGWDCLVVRLHLRIFNFQWKTPEQSLEISASQTTQWWAAGHPICKFQWLQQGSGCQRCSCSPWFDDFDGVLYHFVYYEQTNVSSRWLWHQLVSRVCWFFFTTK